MVMYNEAGYQGKQIKITPVSFPWNSALLYFFVFHFSYVLAYTQKKDYAIFRESSNLVFIIMMIHTRNISQLELQESTATSGILTPPWPKRKTRENCSGLTWMTLRVWLSPFVDSAEAGYFFCLPSFLITVKVNLQWVPWRMKGSDYPKDHTSPDPKFYMAIREIQILI